MPRVTLVGSDLKHRRGWEDDIGVGDLTGGKAVDDHHAIKGLKGAPPGLWIWKGRKNRTAEDDQTLDWIGVPL